MMRLNKLVQDKGNEMKETIIWKKDKAAWKDMLTCLQKEIVDSWKCFAGAIPKPMQFQ